jgi:hypothetical protein
VGNGSGSEASGHAYNKANPSLGSSTHRICEGSEPRCFSSGEDTPKARPLGEFGLEDQQIIPARHRESTATDIPV